MNKLYNNLKKYTAFWFVSICATAGIFVFLIFHPLIGLPVFAVMFCIWVGKLAHDIARNLRND